jgi:hypothetical protein
MEERKKITFKIIKGGEVINTFENEKTNLIKLLSYMSRKALRGKKANYSIELKNQDITTETATVEIEFENDIDKLIYRWNNVPINNFGFISEINIIKILEI